MHACMKPSFVQVAGALAAQIMELGVVGTLLHAAKMVPPVPAFLTWINAYPQKQQQEVANSASFW